MNATLKLSIIVPFYNVEAYIETCIRSLFNQDIPQDTYEVILVDDCSPDRSREIVLRLQQEYPTINLFYHKVNKSLGGARNTGLKAAKGDYIWFIDSDDFIKPNVLHRLTAEAICNKLDILHFDYAIVTTDNEIKEVYKDAYITEVITGVEFFNHTGDIWWKKFAESWRKLYRREFLVDKKLYFLENTYYEDTIHSFETFIYAKRVLHISKAPYCYRHNPQSITNSKISVQKLTFLFITSIRLQQTHEAIKLTHQEMSAKIAELIAYQIKTILENLRQLSAEEKILFFRNIKYLQISRLKPFVKRANYYAFKYPFLPFLSSRFSVSRLLKCRSIL